MIEIVKHFAAKYKVNEDDLRSALSKVRNKEVILYAMSGKMGAGKDTIGDKICSALQEQGYKVVSMSYSTPMRKEMSEIVDFYNKSKHIEETADKFNVESKEIIKFIKILDGKDIYERTPEARLAIQFWGTDVRRKQDKDYWTNKLVELTVEAINNNQSVYISDVRFPNEADSVLDLNGKVIRLEANTNIRANRIMQRDNLVPTFEQLTHASEISLDDYKFEQIFDGLDDPSVLTKQALNYILD